MRHGNRWVQARISTIEHRLDIHTLKPGYYKVQLEVEVLGQAYTVSTERALEVIK